MLSFFFCVYSRRHQKKKKKKTFKHLIYNILLKVHKVVDHNLVNFVFYPNIADTEYNT